ncbi:hypothetical protein ZIOFF_039570 [Zingiber officinale]|uniref:Uncharacterized protein n=1 Tax=Zingiber officinale TaxID=94328 RepID=A0A8J5KUC0_ZINOF|nr:hypothetical protein ZIOFF_039570 [Zingiber officinale]
MSRKPEPFSQLLISRGLLHPTANPSLALLRKIKDRGMVVKDWVEQAEILRHRVVGGFVSHYDWNSVTEAALYEYRVVAAPPPNLGESSLIQAHFHVMRSRMDLNLYLGLPRSPPSHSRDLGSDLSLNSLPWSSPTTTVEERGSSIPMSGAVEPSESHPPYSPSHEEYNPELLVALPEDSDGTSYLWIQDSRDQYTKERLDSVIDQYTKRLDSVTTVLF